MYPNLDRYHGEFIQGRREGLGLLTYANGDTYDGEWINNLFHGHGVFSSVDFMNVAPGIPHTGQRYEGAYEYGRKHGKGIQHLQDGSVYDGEFKNNLFHGEGVLKTKKGDKLMGVFERGKISGSGKIQFANGVIPTASCRAAGSTARANSFIMEEVRMTVTTSTASFTAKGRESSAMAQYTVVSAGGMQEGEGMLHKANNDQYVGMWYRDLPEGGGADVRSWGPLRRFI